MKLFHFLHRKSTERETLFRNFIFGVEDSLVSTVGLLAGVAAADVSKRDIIATGLVLIFVEAFSMGVGAYLTEEATDELDGGVSNQWQDTKGALVMFGSYAAAGLLPLAPYVFLDTPHSTYLSIFLALLGLAALGYGSGKAFVYRYPVRRAVKVAVMGGLAVIVGVIVGLLFQV